MEKSYYRLIKMDALGGTPIVVIRNPHIIVAKIMLEQGWRQTMFLLVSVASGVIFCLQSIPSLEVG